MPLPHQERDRLILEHLQADPNLTQADLAETLGVAVGTVNFALQRLIKKGYVRAQQLQRRRLRYILTPSGLAWRAKLAVDSLNYGMALYRQTRARAQTLLAEARERGFSAVYITGHGDLADIARLTCLEQNMAVAPNPQPTLPVLETTGASLTLRYPPHD